MGDYPWLITWLPLIFLWLIIFWQMKKRKNAVANILKHKKEGLGNMEETIRSFMNTPGFITLISEECIDCEIVSYSDGWIRIKKKTEEQAVNCDYIVKITPRKIKKK